MANPDLRNEAAAVSSALSLLLHASIKSREQIADELSDLTGIRVTLRMLNSYTSDAAEKHRWPAQFDIALCQVLNDYSLLSERVERAGFRMIGPEEERLINIGRAYLQRAEANRLLREAQANG